MFQVHNTCCFLPPPPPPPSTCLSKNSIHQQFSLSSDVLAENNDPADVLANDLSESYPSHLNRVNWRCPYHQHQHRHMSSHCWQNHCCVMSSNLQQHSVDEQQVWRRNRWRNQKKQFEIFQLRHNLKIIWYLKLNYNSVSFSFVNSSTCNVHWLLNKLHDD